MKIAFAGLLALSLISSFADAISSLRRHQGAVDHVKLLSQRMRLAEVSRTAEHQSNQWAEAIADFGGNLIGVDSECDHKKRHYKGQINTENNLIQEIEGQQAYLVEQFDKAFQAASDCETTINAKFDYYGCNPPSDAAGARAMRQQLEDVQENCVSVNAGALLEANATEIRERYTHLAEGNEQWMDQIMSAVNTAVNHMQGGINDAVQWFSDLLSVNNFEEIKQWMQRIQDRAAPLPQQIADAKARKKTAQNNYNHWNKKCSFGGFWADTFGAIADAVVAAAEAVATVIVAILKAVGCLVIDIGLSVIGAFLDGLITAFTGGAANTLAATPIGIFICGPSFAAKTGGKNSDAFTSAGRDKLRSTIKQKTIEGNKQTILKESAKGALQSKGMEEYMNAEVAGCMNINHGANCNSLIFQHQTENRTANAMQFSGQDAFDFLFKLVMAVLGELGKQDCCKPLGDFLNGSGGDWINIIQWLVMRAVDAVCGKFGTFMMEIIKQFTLCNLCSICPKSACTLKFLAFSSACKTYYGGLLEKARSEIEGRKLLSKRMLGDSATEVQSQTGFFKKALKKVGKFAKNVVSAAEQAAQDAQDFLEDPTRLGAPFQVVDGNNGASSCHQTCKNAGYSKGAVGVDEFTVHIPPNEYFVELYAESPLHSDGNGNSPCCTAGHQNNGGGVCTSCTCIK